MSNEVTDSETETETVSEMGDGLLSVILSGSSCNLDDCANNVLTSHYELIIKTIDLQSVVQYLREQGALSDAANILSDESQSLVARKEYLLKHVIKDKGIDGFNLLMGALKSCQGDPNQIALGEKLYSAMQQSFSSSDTSREASPISTREEWMSAYESATDEPFSLDDTHNNTTIVADNTGNEQTPLLPTTSDTNHTPAVNYRKKRVRSCVQILCCWQTANKTN